MSIYAVNKLCRRLVHEPELRARLQSDPESTLRAVQPPLSEEEIKLVMAGDVGRLGRMGANFFLLHMLGRFGLFGLDLQEHGRRVRREYAQERAGWQSKREH
jgi:hypothetical protein